MYTKKEEFWNVITHFIGVILAIPGLTLLLLKNQNKTDYAFISIVVFLFTVLFLYSASTLYHYVVSARKKNLLRKLDHIAIYFLIAGTYTPVTLITLLPSKGLWLTFIVWSIVLMGTIFKIFFTGKFEKLSLILYLLMGWAIVIDFMFLVEQISTVGLALLVLGGFFYTIGTFFYVKEKIPFNHAIWHVFVLLGTISHYIFIYIAVV